MATGNCDGAAPSGVNTIIQSPCIGRSDVALADTTPGISRRRCTICWWASLMRSGSVYAAAGRLTRNVAKFNTSKPGFTARARAKLWIMRPAPTVSTSANATSLTMSTRRPCWRVRSTVDDRPSVRSDRSASEGLPGKLGRIENTSAVSIVRPAVSASTRASTEVSNDE